MLDRGKDSSKVNGLRRARKAVARGRNIATVLIADGDTLFRVGLRDTVVQLFEGANIREVGTCGALNAALSAGEFDLILLDLGLPGLNGYLWLVERRKQLRRTLWIAVSGIDTPRVRQRALALGVARFVSKRASRETIAAAVLSAVHGPRRAARMPAREQQLIDGLTRLTRAELRVLMALPDNPSHRHLMRALGVALPTVKTHMSRILAKLGLRNRTEAAVVASKLSNIESPSLCIDWTPNVPVND